MKTEVLPVQLTGHELIERGTELSTVRERIDELESQRKEAASSLRGQMDELEAKSRHLVRELSTKKTLRSVEVQDEPDLHHNEMVRIRLDTGEVISRRTLTIEEITAARQVQLGLPETSARA